MHRFSIISFEINSDTSLSTPFDTARAGKSGNRTVTFSVQRSTVVVTDSFADAPYTVGETLKKIEPACTQLKIGPLLTWNNSSAQHARQISRVLAQEVPPLRLGLTSSNWEIVVI